MWETYIQVIVGSEFCGVQNAKKKEKDKEEEEFQMAAKWEGR